MNLIELQKILGERIEISKDKKLTESERNAEREQSDIIVRVAKQMINNADVILRTDKFLAGGVSKEQNNISKLLK